MMIRDIFYTFSFGKYKGKTLGDIFEENPSYLIWCDDNVDSFKLSPELRAQVAQQVRTQKLAKDLKNALQKESKTLTQISKGDDIPF
jgi:uncharacterized protein (DUF3820 family)